jgi:hypothetical protein
MMQLKLADLGVTPEQLRAAANAPEVHAAALLAAKEYVLSAMDKGRTVAGSDSVAHTVALHAALLMHSYLEMVGTEGLSSQLALTKPGPQPK